MMKTNMILIASALLLAPLAMNAQSGYSGSDPVGAVSYALPSTTLTLEVQAVQEKFYAGPYAKYAQKYLGIEARQADETTYQLTQVNLVPKVEADQSARFLVTPGKGGVDSFLQLTAQGLISSGDGTFSNPTIWRFPTRREGDFADKGVSSNLTSESTTLYKNVKSESSYNKVAVQQDMVVSKSLEQRAQEAAQMIFDLRKKRVQIVTGDTDATFSGEAMGSAINEITSLEKEYMSMFIGYSEYQTQAMNFDVVPSKANKNQMYVAFRLSDATGLESPDNVSGKPYLLEVVPQNLTQAQGSAQGSSKGQYAVYRIPAICTVKLSDGVNTLLQSRVPVYQLGEESTLPISSK